MSMRRERASERARQPPRRCFLDWEPAESDSTIGDESGRTAGMEIIFDGPRRGGSLRNSTGMPRVFYLFSDPPGQSDRPACNAVIVQVVSDRQGNETRLKLFKQNETGSDAYDHGSLFLLAVSTPMVR